MVTAGKVCLNLHAATSKMAGSRLLRARHCSARNATSIRTQDDADGESLRNRAVGGEDWWDPVKWVRGVSLAWKRPLCRTACQPAVINMQRSACILCGGQRWRRRDYGREPRGSAMICKYPHLFSITEGRDGHTQGEKQRSTDGF